MRVIFMPCPSIHPTHARGYWLTTCSCRYISNVCLCRWFKTKETFLHSRSAKQLQNFDQNRFLDAVTHSAMTIYCFLFLLSREQKGKVCLNCQYWFLILCFKRKVTVSKCHIPITVSFFHLSQQTDQDRILRSMAKLSQSKLRCCLLYLWIVSIDICLCACF